MSRLSKDLPERLLSGEATDFERRVLDAGLEKRPTAAASARIAKALGVTVTTVGTAAAAKALAAQATSKAAVAATSTTWPWISAGLVGLAVAGAVVGTHVRHATPPEDSPSSVVVTVPAAPAPSRPASAVVADIEDPGPAPAKSIHRNRAPAMAGDLRDEIAAVDSARAALSAGDASRALEVLRRYEARYASGSFRPEATAIRIEALVKLGRQSEARTLAARFVAEQRGTLLAKRVAELVGLSDSPAVP
jgi:hypothetical protein